MLKRLIHPENYDEQIAVNYSKRSSQDVLKSSSIRRRLKSIQHISMFVNFLTSVVLVYAVVEISSCIQDIKRELLAGQAHIKKLHDLMYDTIQAKPAAQKIVDKDLAVMDAIEHPTHIKYMGVLKSGNTEKAFIETEQGGILFSPQQMVDSNWKLKKIFEDYLVLESSLGQQVTVYKERSNE